LYICLLAHKNGFMNFKMIKNNRNTTRYNRVVA